MIEYAKNINHSQTRRVLVSIFHLKSGTLETPLFLFCFDVGPVYT